MPLPGHAHQDTASAHRLHTRRQPPLGRLAGAPAGGGLCLGIAPGLALFEISRALGVEEVSVYGFTQDNTRRPSVQKEHFRAACVEFALEIAQRGAALLVAGDETSPQFPQELLPFRRRQGQGIKVNFLVNYGWEWDLDAALDWFSTQDRTLGG